MTTGRSSARWRSGPVKLLARAVGEQVVATTTSTGRTSRRPGLDPNGRRYDRVLERGIKRLDPRELDRSSRLNGNVMWRKRPPGTGLAASEPQFPVPGRLAFTRRASQAEKYAVPQPSSMTSRPATSPKLADLALGDVEDSPGDLLSGPGPGGMSLGVLRRAAIAGPA